ncbi:MAG TPA: DUF4391 domain-containing protein [Bacilli bacterium]|nr:DUF4391 domain-containing protein [Bacilli bacterium]
MFELPKSCLVNKFIPKKTFYEKLNIATSIKDEFINIVDKITWLYKISEDTINISKTEEVEEIEIFQIDLKEKKIPQNVIKIISKAIPYKILFVLKYNQDVCYLVNLDSNYCTNWNEDIIIEFKGFSLENIYQNIVKQIIHETDNSNNFNDIINNVNEKERLLKEISKIKNLILREKQFNKKVELNQTLSKLKKEMEELYND